MKKHPGTFVAGILFLVIGFVYLLEGLDVWTVSPGRIWPLFIIAVGVTVVAGAMFGRDDEPPGDTEAGLEE
ncbi:MAG TPA: DUF5668 domain-containing protein [Acidimicrobiia bacterium]|nr:DUF5668 domain-containing protein [Acidimicrobiia bacterium]